jgi:hypothetical protein
LKIHFKRLSLAESNKICIYCYTSQIPASCPLH